MGHFRRQCGSLQAGQPDVVLLGGDLFLGRYLDMEAEEVLLEEG